MLLSQQVYFWKVWDPNQISQNIQIQNQAREIFPHCKVTSPMEERGEEGSKLGELVHAEIKKAFSICDKDGNGFLDIGEVKSVMQVWFSLFSFLKKLEQKNDSNEKKSFCI